MTAFTKTLACINLIGAVISIALFVTTWFAQGIIIEKARNHALDATQALLMPVVKFLENPKLVEKLPASIEEKLRGELADYESDPKKWLMRIAEGTGDRAVAFEFPEIKNPLARKGLNLFTQRISGAREHFQRSYENLILDLRIFCGTNACAFVLAAWLLFVARTPQMRHWLGAWSVMLLVSTAIGIYCYITQSWLWSFLSNDYIGWSYPALNVFVAVYLFCYVEPLLQARSPADEES